MAFKQRFTFSIPAGETIYEPDFGIAGCHHYISNLSSVLKNTGTSFYIESDPHNQFDSNAIKVIGETKNWFGTKTKIVGYLPAEIAAKVTLSKMTENVMLRPKSLYISDDGYVDFIADLLGPKSLSSKYHSVQS